MDSELFSIDEKVRYFGGGCESRELDSDRKEYTDFSLIFDDLAGICVRLKQLCQHSRAETEIWLFAGLR